MAPGKPSLRIAIFLPRLSSGGVTILLLQFAGEFAARRHQVELLLGRVRAETDRVSLPPGVAKLQLKHSGNFSARLAAMKGAGKGWPLLLRPVLARRSTLWSLRFLPSLATYLSDRRPDVLLSAISWPNLAAIWAARVSGAATKVVVSEQVQLSEEIRCGRSEVHWNRLPELIAYFYRQAAAVITPSNGVADDLAETTGLERSRILALPNPVVSEALRRKAAAPCPHPWLSDDGPPVILGVGRLHPQKDFPNLLEAFAEVRRRRPARLIILGEGSERASLEALAAELGVADSVLVPGFADNPFAYMSRASVFALSSRYEGLGMVLIEAMACGCAVVSTDCPSGPREILENGKFGPLVPLGNPVALAHGIEDCLDNPVPKDALLQRAERYSVAAAADAYLSVFYDPLAPGV